MDNINSEEELDILSNRLEEHIDSLQSTITNKVIPDFSFY